VITSNRAAAIESRARKLFLRAFHEHKSVRDFSPSIKMFTERRGCRTGLCNFAQARRAVNEHANLIRPEEISFAASLDK